MIHALAIPFDLRYESGIWGNTVREERVRGKYSMGRIHIFHVAQAKGSALSGIDTLAVIYTCRYSSGYF